jgi:hypothetical protein
MLVVGKPADISLELFAPIRQHYAAKWPHDDTRVCQRKHSTLSTYCAKKS